MAQSVLFNWKTSITGVVTLVFGLFRAYEGQADAAGYITTGFGLIFAKDAA